MLQLSASPVDSLTRLWIARSVGTGLRGAILFGLLLGIGPALPTLTVHCQSRVIVKHVLNYLCTY